MLGANAGVRVAERFGFEGFFAWIPTRLRADSGLLAHGGRINADSYMWGVTALYHFTNWERLQPFVGLGLGGETMTYRPARLDGHTELQGNAVVGANYWVTDVFGIRSSISVLDSPSSVSRLRSSFRICSRQSPRRSPSQSSTASWLAVTPP